MEENELKAAKKYFHCVDLITDIPDNSFVVGRFSLYPFYYDQVRELKNKNCKLINEHWQYEYIADLKNYVSDLEDMTPKTWDKLDALPEGRSFVLKGETNSRKNLWLTSMFAENKEKAKEIYFKLLDDSLIGAQKIYIREYIPLYTYMKGINGMPVTKEFRLFVAYGKVISSAYYWQNYIDDIDENPNPNDIPKEFIQKVIDRVGFNSNFFVIDIGLTKSGEWIVIELNEGQFSGLSCNEPENLYKNLSQEIIKNVF